MIADMVITFMNSARKNRAKRIELYSVWNPPTISCSASTRSNGGRFSSAVPAIRKMKKGTTPARAGCSSPRMESAWASTMPWVDRVPESRTTVATDSPRAAS